MSEHLDVVNESDRVVDTKKRSFCHSQGLIHRCSAVIVFETESRERILIQKRSLNKEKKPGKLCLTGGHIKSGDTYLEGAKKEFYEELYDNKVIESSKMFNKLFKFRKISEEDPEFVEVFETIDNGPFMIQEDEVETCFFMSIEKLRKQVKESPNDFTTTTRIIVEKYLG